MTPFACGNKTKDINSHQMQPRIDQCTSLRIFLLVKKLEKCLGQYTNYVDRILKFFDHPLPIFKKQGLQNKMLLTIEVCISSILLFLISFLRGKGPVLDQQKDVSLFFRRD